MSEKILINNDTDSSLPLNNNYYQRNDNENSTINKCYQCCSPMFFQRKRNLNRLWGLATKTASSLNQEQSDHQQSNAMMHHPKCPRSCNSTKFDCGGSCMCGNSNGDGNSSDCSISSSTQYQLNPATMQTTNLYQLFYSLTKKLKETQVETLCQAVKHSTNGQTTNCVLVPRLLIEGQEPHVIACRLWRWPDLRYAIELKRIPSCPNEIDPVYVCCNPTHWYRICRRDSPPPPYSLFAMERLKPEDRAPSEERVRDPSIFPGSLSTDGEEKSSSGWCQLAYWEQAQRVGRLFPVENPAVNIFAEQTRGDGLCLTTLAMQRLSVTPDVVLRARQKIGLGVTLSRKSDGVWICNRSSAPVFVHSPTLSDIDTRSVLVSPIRLATGYCLRAFDHDKAAKESYSWPTTIAGNGIGPVDNYSVRISFAKGWGPNYSRLEVKSCPCWLEVLLNRAPSEERVRDPSIFPGSLSTDGEEKSSSGWCQLAYWEQAQRVGRLFPVENPAVNIFAEQTRGDGLCLTTLAMQRLSVTPDVVLRARQKIGLGVTLSRKSDGVWIYNRSSAPVFVHSPTLSDIDTRSVLVSPIRLATGYCLRAFDHDKAAKESYSWPTTIAGNGIGPVDNYSVRISFAKGWGPNYSRLEVKSCPCWLEVLLSKESVILPCR